MSDKSVIFVAAAVGVAAAAAGGGIVVIVFVLIIITGCVVGVQWSAAMEKCGSGGLYSTDWSRDSTGFVCGCGDGKLLMGKVIEK